MAIQKIQPQRGELLLASEKKMAYGMAHHRSFRWKVELNPWNYRFSGEPLR